MAIYLGSRYEDSALFQDTTRRATTVGLRANPSVPREYGSYLVVEGDRLERLAYQFYGRADLWWALADANPTILLPDPLVPGTVLRIPSAFDLR